MWATVLVASLGCYLLKLAGLSLPERLLAGPRLQRMVALVPVALLAALIATQTFSDGRHLALDARAGGLVVAAIAVARRAPFLVVVASAAVATAMLRLAA
jgi:branched-subunit amino acid transport protein